MDAIEVQSCVYCETHSVYCAGPPVRLEKKLKNGKTDF